jgi:hypothetical protein
MALVKSTKIRFTPSPSPDVVSHNLYIEEAPNPVTYDSTHFDIGNTRVTVEDVEYVEVDLSTVPGMLTTDGVYNIGVSPIDDAGNLGTMTKLDDVALDFAAPDAVGELLVIRE